jgi:streptogramin lyase
MRGWQGKKVDMQLGFSVLFFTLALATSTAHAAEYALPKSGSYPEAITTGPDGNLWFTESGTNKIGRLSP